LIAFVGDTHFGAKNFSKSVFETMMEFFESQFFPFLLKHGVKEVFQVGDLVHNRNQIDLWLLQELKERFLRWFDENGVRLHCVIGNHDSYYKNTLSHYFHKENVKEFENVLVYDEVTVVEVEKYLIGVVPWQVNGPRVPDIKADLLCGHFDISGIPIMKNIFSSGGISQDSFGDFRYVISGHYHIKSTSGNIFYVGTPYQLNWGDYDEQKGFHTLGSNFQLKFLPNTVNPKFLKAFYAEDETGIRLSIGGLDGKIRTIEEKELIQVVKNNYVKLITSKVKDQSSLENFHSSIQMFSKNGYKVEMVNSDEIIEDFDFEQLERSLESETDVLTVAEGYLDAMTFEESVCKDTLRGMLRSLYVTSQENMKGLEY
jgi:DNA repair exonuclease SbcCD nuclease subunit